MHCHPQVPFILSHFSFNRTHSRSSHFLSFSCLFVCCSLFFRKFSQNIKRFQSHRQLHCTRINNSHRVNGVNYGDENTFGVKTKRTERTSVRAKGIMTDFFRKIKTTRHTMFQSNANTICETVFADGLRNDGFSSRAFLRRDRHIRP